MLVTAYIPTLAQGGGFPPELWVPLIVLGLIVAAGIAGGLVQRRRRRLVDEAISRLVREARFEPIEDPKRLEALGQCVHELLTGEHAPSDDPLPLAHAVSYTSDGLTLNVLHVAQTPRTASITEPDSLVVICEGFDQPLPEFRLLPANALLRQAMGDGLYPRESRFGHYNLVLSREPDRTRAVLDEEAQALLDRNDAIAIECTPERLIVYRHDNKGQPEGLMPFVEDCLTLAQILRDNTRAAGGELNPTDYRD